MEKYLTVRNGLYLLVVIGVFCLYKFYRVTKESHRLLGELNSSNLPATMVVDKFAEELGAPCTRFMIKTKITLKGGIYDAHLTVFIGNKNYEYAQKNNKWFLIRD